MIFKGKINEFKPFVSVLRGLDGKVNPNLSQYFNTSK